MKLLAEVENGYKLWSTELESFNSVDPKSVFNRVTQQKWDDSKIA